MKVAPSVANAFFDQFNVAIGDFIRRADRTTLRASLFDVPRRTELSARCYASAIGPFLDQVVASVSPEELGTMMRGIARRPNSLHIVGIPWLYLFEREERVLSGRPLRPDHELREVLEFCARVLSAYRQDGNFVPTPPRWDMPIADRATVEALATEAWPLSEGTARALRRSVAMLELFSFVLHGEHRDGIFDHGSYRWTDDHAVVVKDFTDLQNDFLPWFGLDLWLPCRAVSVIFVVQPDASVRFDLWGTSRWDDDVYQMASHVAVYGHFADDVRPLGAEDLGELAQMAQRSQQSIFLEASRWPEEQRAAYGLHLFANHLREIPRLLGLGTALESELLCTFEETAREHIGEVLDRDASPVWGRLARELPFSPITDLTGR